MEDNFFIEFENGSKMEFPKPDDSIINSLSYHLIYLDNFYYRTRRTKYFTSWTLSDIQITAFKN